MIVIRLFFQRISTTLKFDTMRILIVQNGHTFEISYTSQIELLLLFNLSQ